MSITTVIIGVGCLAIGVLAGMIIMALCVVSADAQRAADEAEQRELIGAEADVSHLDGARS